MSYRILVEIIHEASIRTKRTPEGFTHDWEIFVRGCDADISHYVDRVVFNLHHTFSKPRRVLKEPPYKVKESGYAGFNLLIEIYLKNSEEPKKIPFYYDLHLQPVGGPSGQPIYKVQKEKYVFHHPNEDFRQRLLKGGATLINTPSSHSESSREFPGGSDEQRSQLVDKPKLGGDMTKKPKIRTEETKLSNSFADLFGPPITKTAKVSPDPKLQQIKSSPKNMNIKNEKNAQQEKSSKSNKHSPQKDKSERSKEKDHSKKNKEERRSKDKTKERDKSKEKSTKKDKSPPRRSSTSPRRSPKRESSPKKSSSPKRVSSPSPKPKFEERNKYDESIKEKQNNDNTKSDKKVKKDKRDKVKDRDKDKREHKQHSKEENKTDIEPKENTMKSVYKDTNNVKPTKDTTSKDKEQIKLKEKIKQSEHQQQQSSVVRAEIKDSEKHKSVKHEISEKHKHKHKKKDREKSKKDDKERRHDKNKNDKMSSDTQINTSKAIVSNDSTKILPTVNNEIEKENHQNKNNSTQAPNSETFISTRDETSKVSRDKLSTNPLNTLIAELSENESSDSSNHSVKNNTDVRIRNKINSKSSNNVVDSTPTPLPPPPPQPVEMQKEFAPTVVPPVAPPSIEQNDKKNDDRVEKTKKSKKHRDKHKSNKSPDKDIERKRKRKSSSKIDDIETSSDKIINNDEQPRPMKQIKGERKLSEEEKIEQNTADYMNILKDLQHKIMTLQDNSELQRVVQLIAETGQYEITRQTFDFDLCALDRKTVDRLQEFFKAT
ncbi:protein AF-9-like [Chrysoperla carnea]|uniref:protein AF-9-like n=1 Tax=Chrysoperla carnea TaxID=189513 RepID=UPI001D07314A|nr:protein AF-9-like [Chrysoperla carnea]